MLYTRDSEAADVSKLSLKTLGIQGLLVEGDSKETRVAVDSSEGVGDGERCEPASLEAGVRLCTGTYFAGARSCEAAAA
jgi:hypothetical protein